ncbi:3-oxoadipate enol-lactonase [Gemmobacter nectariphilus]|uniref:3-oxoadipate enol-lactonase n=1 Tax=Gemmobacter nectariphilus TaxID=220343 RepID=UPI0004026DE0|nr:3-oxoadipate enol-lactonase [Gemmobacter nectariphilus]
MNICDLGDIRLHWREDGDPAGAPVVFANSLGTDLRLWDKVIPLLPQGYRYIRYDKRGHGLSDCPPGPYSMGALVRDAERLLDALEVRDCVFVGLSIGGMIAQGLAIKRLDLVRAMVISNTAAKIGTAEMWHTRIAAARDGGLAPMADAVMERWFSRAFRQGPELAGWRNMMVRTPLEGYVGCCAAIAGTDFYTPTSGLTLPTLAIAGSEDGSTPPDLVRETADLIRGSEFHLIRGAGHLPCVEAPEAYAARLAQFLERVGHAQGCCGHDHPHNHGHHH